LLFARQLQEILIASGRFDVALTRDDDTFFRLEDRVQVARQNKADLLISLHADSFEDDSIKGASVYIRDEQATDVLDKVLAENENKVDLLAGFVPPEGEEAAVVDILVDLMRREMRRQSFAVAQALVEQLRPSVRVRRFPLRRADFFVLQSPDVPAVLLELGFLSNSSDARNLTSPEWRQRAAEAVARGLVAHFDRAR
jgi:N-acetylmuramoyl-L-alanine amidase